MNRTRNWSFITTFFVLASLVAFGTVAASWVAIALGAVSFVTGAMAVIRYEDSLKVF